MNLSRGDIILYLTGAMCCIMDINILYICVYICVALCIVHTFCSFRIPLPRLLWLTLRTVGCWQQATLMDRYRPGKVGDLELNTGCMMNTLITPCLKHDTACRVDYVI